MLMSTPLAPFIEWSSSSGLEIALSAATRLRSGPSASPVPIIALPISPITVRMSAKSRLIRPGITIRSVTPRTPMCSTSSAILKASAKVVFSLAILNRFWLGMTISVSTTFSNSVMPCSADCMRRRPSKWNGLVTTPMVRMPCSRAAAAMTGAAPVPVPPPMPAVTNTMLAPSRSWRISGSASSAAWRPTLGPRARAQALRHRDAELHTAVGERLAERLRVGVGDNELHALERSANHVVDGISARAADTHDGDSRLNLGLLLGEAEVDCHTVFSTQTRGVSARSGRLGPLWWESPYLASGVPSLFSTSVGDTLVPTQHIA